jgi:hypothetical protein
VINDESLDLDLILEGVGSEETMRAVVVILRQMKQKFQQRPDPAEQQLSYQEWRESLAPDSGHLVGFLDGLNPNGRAAICKMGWPLVLIAECAPDATERLLGMIGGWGKDIQARNAQMTIFTAQNNVRQTFPMLVAEFAPNATERLLNMIEAFEYDR